MENPPFTGKKTLTFRCQLLCLITRGLFIDCRLYVDSQLPGLFTGISIPTVSRDYQWKWEMFPPKFWWNLIFAKQCLAGETNLWIRNHFPGYVVPNHFCSNRVPKFIISAYKKLPHVQFKRLTWFSHLGTFQCWSTGGAQVPKMIFETRLLWCCVKNHGCIANFYINQPLFFEVSQQNPHFSKLLWTFPMKHEFCSPGLMGWWVSVGLSWFMGWKKLKNWLDHNMYPLGMTNSSPWYRWPMEIDGLPINSMVDLSMANC